MIPDPNAIDGWWAFGFLMAALYGAVGMWYFVRGKREPNMLYLVTGIALMAFPGFMPLGWMLTVGTMLALLPPALEHL